MMENILLYVERYGLIGREHVCDNVSMKLEFAQKKKQKSIYRVCLAGNNFYSI